MPTISSLSHGDPFGRWRAKVGVSARGICTKRIQSNAARTPPISPRRSGTKKISSLEGGPRWVSGRISLCNKRIHDYTLCAPPYAIGIRDGTRKEYRYG